MASSRSYIGVLAVAGVFALTPASDATTLLHMNLADLAHRADLIVRAEVLAVRNGSVAVGGGEVPVHIYRLRVDEAFKGNLPEATDKGTFVEVKMVAALKAKPAASGAVRVPLFRDLPDLQVGRQYVLFTTPASQIGLSTTVGLGQGAFKITGAGKAQEQAVNAFGNVGLASGMENLNFPTSGAVSYAQLAEAIRAVVGR